MNVKKLISLALIALSATFTFAQQKQAGCPPSFQRNTGKMSVVDSTRLRVWYAMNADSILDMDTYIDYQRLDVGDSISRYYSWFVYNSDSIIKEWRKQNPKAQSIQTIPSHLKACSYHRKG